MLGENVSRLNRSGRQANAFRECALFHWPRSPHRPPILQRDFIVRICIFLSTGDNHSRSGLWNDPGHPSEQPVFFIHVCGSGDVSDLSASPNAEWAGLILQAGSE